MKRMSYLSRLVQGMAMSCALFAVAGCMFVSCGSDGARYDGQTTSRLDSIVFDAGVQKDYLRMIALVDSFEATGQMSSMDANRWRGSAYYHMKHYRTSEIYYKQAVEADIVTAQDLLCYIKSARRLSELLLIKGDYEGSIRVAMPAVQKMEETGTGSDIDFAILQNNIGCCQINLGRDEEANESFITARGHYINRWTTDSTGRGFQEAVIGTVYTSQAYINTKRYVESRYWIDRTENLLNKYAAKPDARREYFDEYKGRIEIMRAVAQQGMELPDSAEDSYQKFLATDYSKTPAGRINANDYLIAAGRYAEAADNYSYLDAALRDWGTALTLDNIQQYILPKMRANIEVGRTDSVVALADVLCNRLDSAIASNKSDDTAELATIYETNQKKAQIERQQTTLARQRMVTTLVALGLMTVFFIIYTLNRRRSTKRLASAHAKLQTAYDQLEQTTMAKERIESELRIARDIQMSMVPNVFPDYEGLDIYATMIPAKEVGGDLYGYLMVGNNLYFCLGDVSGKGVPASLFMAQATRLFRTLATQNMMPDEIATRMNAELAESNEQGMFVTMFIGLVNLKTGRLDFCNAGHNPPVIGNKDGKCEFMVMEPNAPIGLWPELKYIGESIDDFRGRPLLVYSDGLNEAENREQEQFGEDRMINILGSMSFGNAKKVVEHLIQAVEQHRNGAEPNDDLTMLCMKVG